MLVLLAGEAAPSQCRMVAVVLCSYFWFWVAGVADPLLLSAVVVAGYAHLERHGLAEPYVLYGLLSSLFLSLSFHLCLFLSLLPA